jgi:hypothetical protein
MRALVLTSIVCVSVSYTALALAAPKLDAAGAYTSAVQLNQQGDYEHAIAMIDQGLALAPKGAALLKLLLLKGAVLVDLWDYAGAKVVYQAYLDAGATGANRRLAEQTLATLHDTDTTYLDIQIANGPAAIYLDSKTKGVFCTAAPSCNKAIIPRDYKVIVERAGFDRWTGRTTVVKGKTAKLAVSLVEKPSLLTVRAEPAGAKVLVDDKPFDAPAAVAAGAHQVAVSLAGYAGARLEATAHEGKPVELAVALVPLVPVRVQPAGAELRLDDKPIAIEDGGIAIPPGRHGLIARARGFRDVRVEIPAERAADYTLAIELPRADLAVAESTGLSGRRKVALAVGGAGVVALAGGIVFGIQSQHLADDALAVCPSPSTPCAAAAHANELSQNGRSHALRADIAYGVAAGAAIGAAVLWLTGAPESPSRVAVTPRIGPVAGLDVSFGF